MNNENNGVNSLLQEKNNKSNELLLQSNNSNEVTDSINDESIVQEPQEKDSEYISLIEYIKKIQEEQKESTNYESEDENFETLNKKINNEDLESNNNELDNEIQSMHIDSLSDVESTAVEEEIEETLTSNQNEIIENQIETEHVEFVKETIQDEDLKFNNKNDRKISILIIIICLIFVIVCIILYFNRSEFRQKRLSDDESKSSNLLSNRDAMKIGKNLWNDASKILWGESIGKNCDNTDLALSKFTSDYNYSVIIRNEATTHTKEEFVERIKAICDGTIARGVNNSYINTSLDIVSVAKDEIRYNASSKYCGCELDNNSCPVDCMNFDYEEREFIIKKVKNTWKIALFYLPD